jgi:aryl-alcohol dehydrogenase-like predicted oxidoreductase
VSSSFTHTTLGRTGLRVHRLGLAATYFPGKKTVHRAIDAGLNYFFAFGVDYQLITVLRDVIRSDRSRCVLATGAYNFIWGYQNLRRTLEKRLRQFRTDVIDVFLFLGVTREKEFPEPALEEMLRFREEGKVRAVGMSCHDRPFAGRMAARGALDVLMIRYNAAHRGAEVDIFPYLVPHDPGVVSYTATRWHALLERPKGWPENRPVPDAGMVYRFVLSNPHVHVCLTAPANIVQFEENLASLSRGPLTDDEASFMREFGDAVHRRQRWFMERKLPP